MQWHSWNFQLWSKKAYKIPFFGLMGNIWPAPSSCEKLSLHNMHLTFTRPALTVICVLRQNNCTLLHNINGHIFLFLFYLYFLPITYAWCAFFFSQAGSSKARNRKKLMPKQQRVQVREVTTFCSHCLWCARCVVDDHKSCSVRFEQHKGKDHWQFLGNWAEAVRGTDRKKCWSVGGY